MKHSLGLVALTLLLASGARAPDEMLTVTRKTTKLREAKRLFAPAVAELHEGDKLVLEKKEGAWLAVQLAVPAETPPRTVKGWLHETDVSAKPDVRLSGEGDRCETCNRTPAAVAESAGHRRAFSVRAAATAGTAAITGGV
jgi:hypothetical protein